MYLAKTKLKHRGSWMVLALYAYFIGWHVCLFHGLNVKFTDGFHLPLWREGGRDLS